MSTHSPAVTSAGPPPSSLDSPVFGPEYPPLQDSCLDVLFIGTSQGGLLGFTFPGPPGPGNDLSRRVIRVQS